MDRPPIALTQNEIRRAASGELNTVVRPLVERPPAEFCEGGVAPVTNGELWAISKLPGSRSWPPGATAGLRCPYGAPGTLLAPDLTPPLQIVDIELDRLFAHLSFDRLMADLLTTTGHPDRNDAEIRALAAEWDARYGVGDFSSNPWVWVLSVRPAAPAGGRATP